MSCIITDIKLSELSFDQTQTQVSAEVKVTFILEDEGRAPVLGRMKHNLCINIKKGAPKRRIIRRLKSDAVKCQQAYFDGEDDGAGLNIFKDITDTHHTTISRADEVSLQKELLAIAQEFSVAA